jgi:hypothetical protein
MFFASSVNATDYTFTGSGSWTDPNNWLNGLVPPGSLPSGSTITINGTTATAQACPNNSVCGAPVYLLGNNGTITIASGGFLTIPNGTQFSNGGSLIVYGTLINKTTFEGFSVGSVTVYGLLLNGARNFGNQGLVTINSGGILRNEALFDNDMSFGVQKGTIVLNSGGTLQNVAPAVFKLGKVTNNGGIINNAANLSGNATITGSLINSGTLAPGNSPGTYTIDEDYTATSSAIHNFEVGGTAISTYDRLLVSGTVNLSGTLNVTLINNYASTSNDNIPIITGTISGTFTNVNIPNNYILIYNATSVNLKSSSVLPVTFFLVEAKKESSGTKLTWKVQSEQDVLRYEVEKSKDGSAYSVVGAVAASGLSQYSFIDVPTEGESFYRIKSVDKDGKYKYSPVVRYMQETGGMPFKVFENHGQNSITVQHNRSISRSKITIIAMDGRLIKSVLPKQGENQTIIELPGMKVSAYVVRYEDGFGKVETAKFIKQ